MSKINKLVINKLVKELIDTDKLQPADIEDLRQFWLTMHVPSDAKLDLPR